MTKVSTNTLESLTFDSSVTIIQFQGPGWAGWEGSSLGDEKKKKKTSTGMR
jgi:hypothetical protein